MQRRVSTVNVCSLCFVNGVLVLQLASLASATAGVASLASHHMATQNLSITEMIKLSG